jgi:hypothetical protein
MIVLEERLRIGDEVVYFQDPESARWIKGQVPDGTVGTVVGWKSFFDYVGHTHNFGRKPGVYFRLGGACVRWETGIATFPSAHDLAWLHDHDKTQKARQKSRNPGAFRQYTGNRDSECWMHELPDLPIWEMDVVKLKDSVAHCFPNGRARVQRINWSYFDDEGKVQRRNDDVTPMPLYDCTSDEPGYGTIAFDSTEVELLERGNVWKWFNAKDTLVFQTLEEELKLHYQLGLYSEVRNPTSGAYSWSLDEALSAIDQSIADGFSVGVFPFSNTHSISMHKFHNAALGARVRERTIEGFPNEVRRIRQARSEISTT